MLRPRPVETVVRRVDDDDLDNVRRLLAENQGKRVFLHKRGKVNVKFDQSSPLGQPLSVLSNYPIRSKVWPITHCCVNGHNGDIAIGDERGQIFIINVKSGSYRVAKLASSALACIEFIYATGNLVAALENGTVTVIDSKTKEKLENIQADTSWPIRMMKSHPNEPIVAMVSDNVVLSIWDMRSYRCVLSFDATEPVVCFDYEKGGEILVVVFLQSGLSLYDSSDGSLLAQGKLPTKMRHPEFTAYTSSHSLHSAFLIGNNGLIYIWNLHNIRAKSKSGRVKHYETYDLPFVGTIELPMKINIPIALFACRDVINDFKVLIMGDNGSVLIATIHSKTDGYDFKICSDIHHDIIFNGQVLFPIDSIVVGRPKCPTNALCPRIVSDRSTSIITCLGIDGCIRLFNINSLIGLTCDNGILGKAVGSDENDEQYNQVRAIGHSHATELKSTNATILRNNKIAQDILDLKLAQDTEAKSAKGVRRTSSGKEINTMGHPPPKLMSVAQKHAALRKILKLDEAATVPLFTLANYVSNPARISSRKLRVYLLKIGEYPERYRTIIWRYLLKLPENTDAYIDLVHRGPHKSYEGLQMRFPMRSRRTFERLHRCCCQVAHWSPVFAQVSYLPQIIFPFLLIFGSDELAVFETVISILMWWGHNWHVTYPHPPVHVLDTYACLIHHHDAKLDTHFKNNRCSVGIIGWNMISSLFTEVLKKADWLILMDFLLSYFANQEYFYLVPMAIMKSTRNRVLAITDNVSIVSFYRSQQEVDIREVLKTLEMLRVSTPKKLLSIIDHKRDPGLHDSDSDSDDGVDNSKRASRAGYDESAQARESIARSRGKPKFPLPSGRYPAFEGFPTFIVDWQIKDRERVLNLQDDVLQRNITLRDLQKQIDDLQKSHEKWMLEHRNATKTEIWRRTTMMEEEKRHLHELLTLEDAISKQKAASLESQEEAARQKLQLLETLSKESQNLIAASDAHIKEKMETYMAMQKYRELAETSEFSSMERISRMFMKQTKEEWLSSLAMTLDGKEKELEYKNILVGEMWKQDDETERQKRLLRTVQNRNEIDSETFSKVQMDIMERMQRLQLQRDAKVMEIERSRAVRLAREQADEASEIAERSLIMSQKGHVIRSRQESAKIAEENLSNSQKHLLETVEMIRAEGERIIEIERKHIEKQRVSRSNERNSELRKEWANQKEKQLRAVLDAEEAVQEQVLRMQRAVMQADVSDDISEKSSKSLEKVKERIEKLGEDVLRDQRARFQELRDEALGFERSKTVSVTRDFHTGFDEEDSSVESASIEQNRLNISMIPAVGPNESFSSFYSSRKDNTGDLDSTGSSIHSTDLKQSPMKSIRSISSKSSELSDIEQTRLVTSIKTSIPQALDVFKGTSISSTRRSNISSSSSSTNTRSGLEELANEGIRVLSASRTQLRKDTAADEVVETVVNTSRMRSYDSSHRSTPRGLFEQDLSTTVHSELGGDLSIGGDSALWAAFSESESDRST